MTRKKKLLFIAFAALLGGLVVEAASCLLLSVASGGFMPPSRILERQLAVSGEASASDPETVDLFAPESLGKEAIHPYLGFVLDASFHQNTRRRKGGQDALDFGFVLIEPGIFHPPSKERPVIAFTGGSVAFNFAQALGKGLRRDFLSHLPGYENARLVNLALPGFKQPQQLMVLNYFQALGAHFELIINLDGFNEIALPLSENLRAGVYPFYPRSWFFRVQDLDPSLRVGMGKLAFTRERRRHWAVLFARAPWRFSPTVGLLWTVLDRRLSRTAAELEVELRWTPERYAKSYTVSGPPWPEASEEETYRQLVLLWKRASLQMHDLAAGRGSRYYHFLQPNQYVEGSKPMGPEERRTKVLPTHTYGQHAIRAYHLLIEHGRELSELGIRYHDLTPIFAGVEEPVYGDACCHLNELGESLMAQAIGTAIHDDLAAAGDVTGAEDQRGP